MWTLIVLGIVGGSSSTQPNLAMCQQQYRQANVGYVRDAYCLSATGDRVYFVKDGRSIEPAPPR